MSQPDYEGIADNICSQISEMREELETLRPLKIGIKEILDSCRGNTGEDAIEIKDQLRDLLKLTEIE